MYFNSIFSLSQYYLTKKCWNMTKNVPDDTKMKINGYKNNIVLIIYVILLTQIFVWHIILLNSICLMNI